MADDATATHATGQFRVVAPFSPKGDQPRAIEELTRRILARERHSCLLGATGPGPPFPMANVIEALGRPPPTVHPAPPPPPVTAHSPERRQSSS